MELDRLILCVRHVLITDACDELTSRRPTFARQHQVVQAPRSHHAGQNSLHVSDSLGQKHTVHALGVNIDDELFKPMVYNRRDSRCAGRMWWSRPRTPMLLSSRSLLEVWQPVPALHATTGTHAVATSSPHHVPDVALKPAGLFRVWDSFLGSFGAAFQLDTNTCNSGGARSPLRTHSGRSFPDTEVSRIFFILWSENCCSPKQSIESKHFNRNSLP